MEKIKLSYVMTTFNKLYYLKVTLPILISHRKEDEEIIVIDGGSTDGSADFLKQLAEERKIDQFVSEKDFGEAHGTNKGFLLARGELIKIITDDDVFHYESINECKKFMLEDKSIDILGFDGFGLNVNHETESFQQVNYINGFYEWKISQTPFLFCGLSFMMRKTSMAYMGLFNVNYKIVDIEYAIRVSTLKVRIAFYTGLAYVNIVNPQSNSHKFYELIAKERESLTRLYPSYRNKITYKDRIVRLKEFISSQILKRPMNKESKFDYAQVVEESLKKLNEHNSGHKFEFLT